MHDGDKMLAPRRWDRFDLYGLKQAMLAQRKKSMDIGFWLSITPPGVRLNDLSKLSPTELLEKLSALVPLPCLH
jgi:hypothetical protein